jgi:hypothetical protein
VEPSPLPTVYVVTQGGSGTDPWLIFVPLIVSVVAVCGAIFTAWYSGRKTIEAENKRSRAALRAENARSRAAIKAEDRRHLHALEVETRRRAFDSRHDLYIEIEGARLDVNQAARRCRWIRVADVESRSERVQMLQEAVDRLGRALTQASLYGSTAVSNRCGTLWGEAYNLLDIARRWILTEDAEDHAEMVKAYGATIRLCRELLAELRAEVGVLD